MGIISNISSNCSTYEKHYEQNCCDSGCSDYGVSDGCYTPLFSVPFLFGAIFPHIIVIFFIQPMIIRVNTLLSAVAVGMAHHHDEHEHHSKPTFVEKLHKYFDHIANQHAHRNHHVMHYVIGYMAHEKDTVDKIVDAVKAKAKAKREEAMSRRDTDASSHLSLSTIIESKMSDLTREDLEKVARELLATAAAGTSDLTNAARTAVLGLSGDESGVDEDERALVESLPSALVQDSEDWNSALNDAFEEFDVNGDGRLSVKELKIALKKYCPDVSLTSSEVSMLIRCSDPFRQHGGNLTRKTFMDLCSGKEVFFSHDHGDISTAGIFNACLSCVNVSKDTISKSLEHRYPTDASASAEAADKDADKSDLGSVVP